MDPNIDFKKFEQDRLDDLLIYNQYAHLYSFTHKRVDTTFKPGNCHTGFIRKTKHLIEGGISPSFEVITMTPGGEYSNAYHIVTITEIGLIYFCQNYEGKSEAPYLDRYLDRFFSDITEELKVRINFNGSLTFMCDRSKDRNEELNKYLEVMFSLEKDKGTDRWCYDAEQLIDEILAKATIIRDAKRNDEYADEYNGGINPYDLDI